MRKPKLECFQHLPADLCFLLPWKWCKKQPEQIPLQTNLPAWGLRPCEAGTAPILKPCCSAGRRNISSLESWINMENCPHSRLQLQARQEHLPLSRDASSLVPEHQLIPAATISQAYTVCRILFNVVRSWVISALWHYLLLVSSFFYHFEAVNFPFPAWLLTFPLEPRRSLRAPAMKLLGKGTFPVNRHPGNPVASSFAPGLDDTAGVTSRAKADQESSSRGVAARYINVELVAYVGA